MCDPRQSPQIVVEIVGWFPRFTEWDQIFGDATRCRRNHFTKEITCPDFGTLLKQGDRIG